MRKISLIKMKFFNKLKIKEHIPTVMEKLDIDNFGKKQDDYGRTKKLS
jgi:hypothetical protein